MVTTDYNNIWWTKILFHSIVIWLVVPTHLKNISQNGNLPQIGVKIKNIWNHHPVIFENGVLCLLRTTPTPKKMKCLVITKPAQVNFVSEIRENITHLENPSIFESTTS